MRETPVDTAKVNRLLAEVKAERRAELDLSDALLTDADLMRILSDKEGLASVRSLSLERNWGITDAGAEAIARGLPSLTSLALWRCGVGDAGVKALAKGLSLTHPDLWGWQKVGDDGVKAIAQDLPSLTSLALSKCRVSDAGAEAIARGLRSLTSLKLSWCQVGDAGVEAIARGLP